MTATLVTLLVLGAFAAAVLYGVRKLSGMSSKQKKRFLKKTLNSVFIWFEDRKLLPRTPAFDHDYLRSYPGLKRLEDGYAVTDEIVDVWRGEGESFVHSWEDRYVVQEGFAPRLVEGPLSRLFAWSLRWASKPPFATALQLEAEGEGKGGEPRRLRLRLAHADGYEVTAIPVVACLLQWLDGGARKPGLATMANIVEPSRFLGDLERLGVRVECEESEGAPRGHQ